MLRDEVAQLVEEQKTKLNEGTVKIVKEIYDEIYCKFREQYIVIFYAAVQVQVNINRYEIG